MGNQLSTQVEAIFSNDNVSALSNLLSSRTVTSVDAPIDEVENTLLHLAVQHGKSRKKERINAFFSWRLTKSEKRFFFFFFFFFFKGAIGCATLLTESGASSNAVNKLACTPLHSAVFAGHVPLAELLLQRGADVHVQDRDGMTPLHWAVAERRFSLIEPLVNGNYAEK
jgi:ankyrin repeat protein